jgi:hypothetical protein
MRKLPVILGSILLTASCSNFESSNKDKAEAKKQESEINFSVGKSTLNLVETSYVKEVELVCPDYTETIVLSEANQSAIVYRNIADCDLNLKKFVVNVDGSENEYSITNRTSEGRNV